MIQLSFQFLKRINKNARILCSKHIHIQQSSNNCIWQATSWLFLKPELLLT